jgi:hypothetical protein
LDNVETVIWLLVSVAMVSTAMQTVQGQHVRQDLQSLTTKNVERIAKLITRGWVRITVVDAVVASFGLKKSKNALNVIIVVRSVWARDK